MLRRIPPLPAVAIAVCLALAGCASSASHQPHATGTGGTNSAAGTTFGPMAVVSAKLIDATHLQIIATVASGNPGCAVNPIGNYDQDEHTVFVQLYYTSTQPQRTGTCAKTANIPFTVAIPPLRGRHISIDNGNPWQLAKDGRTFAECRGPFGCNAPPANHCDPQWLTLVGHSGELPPERYWTNRGCTQQWLVMDITATVTGCQPMDGRAIPTGCRNYRQRSFYTWDPHTGYWSAVASGNSAGCAPVASVPAFPRALCTHLPALS